MAEVLVEFAEPAVDKDGTRYVARACGAETGKGMWHGWIEFLPLGPGEIVRSGRETTQPNRQDTIYWATGLTPIYLEGALHRALTPVTRQAARPPLSPIFDGPAPETAPHAPASDSILNPFAVYRKGERLLRSQLRALSAWHLVNIIRAHGLTEGEPLPPAATSPAVLAEIIIDAVRNRTEAQTREQI